MKIKEVKQKIQQLIDQATDEKIKQEKLAKFLFQKKAEVQELETMERLKEYEGGKYLRAFLLYKSISRANYQTEHLPSTNYQDSAKYLAAINAEIDNLTKKGPLPTVQPKEQLDNSDAKKSDQVNEFLKKHKIIPEEEK